MTEAGGKFGAAVQIREMTIHNQMDNRRNMGVRPDREAYLWVMDTKQRRRLKGFTHEIPLRRPVVEGPVARLLDLFPGLGDRTTRVTRLLLSLIGFLPVTLIAASTFGIVGLRGLATDVLVPALCVATLVVGRDRWARHLVIRAMVVGVLATGMYDLIRFGFIWAAFMHLDPIPHIGVDLHLRPAWVVGYLWRYLGNGAGLSIAFFSLGFSRIRQGLMFGFFVALGLITVLIISPHAAEVLWPLSTISVSMIIIGHLVFGAGLGYLHRFVNPCPSRDAVQPGITITADAALVPVAA